MVDIERVTRNIKRAESLLILLSVVAIAYADRLAGPDTSLGFLYLIPLSYSTLTHPAWLTGALMLVCVVLRQWLGPLEQASWGEVSRDVVLTGIFLALVARLLRLGSDRQDFWGSARSQRDGLLREMRLAARVQRHILGRSAIPRQGLDVSARTWPARVVGGDYYDLSKLPGSRYRVVIGDVAGKGLPAALLMPAIRMAVGALDEEGERSEGEIASELNRLLYHNTPDAMYTTLFYSVLDPATGWLSYANAGHLPPLLTRADGSQHWLEAGGPPVGLLQRARIETHRTRLEPGDRLLLYTDGVVEAVDGNGQEFGAERLAALVGELSHLDSKSLVLEIHDRVHAFADTAEEGDDLTAIAVRRR